MKYKLIRYDYRKENNYTDKNLGKDVHYKRFEDLVTEHLNKGWKCQGSPSTKYTGNDGNTGNDEFSPFYESCSCKQAMVKE